MYQDYVCVISEQGLPTCFVLLVSKSQPYHSRRWQACAKWCCNPSIWDDLGRPRDRVSLMYGFKLNRAGCLLVPRRRGGATANNTDEERGGGGSNVTRTWLGSRFWLGIMDRSLSDLSPFFGREIDEIPLANMTTLCYIATDKNDALYFCHFAKKKKAMF